MRKIKFRENQHKFPPEIIEYTVGLFYKSKFSFPDIEELLAERGILVRYETVRTWCNKYTPEDFRRNQLRNGSNNSSTIDYVQIDMHGQKHFLWRLFDSEGDLKNIYLQSNRNSDAAKNYLEAAVR